LSLLEKYGNIHRKGGGTYKAAGTDCLGKEETPMDGVSRWVKRDIQCPQDMRPSYLLVEYHMEEDGKETLRSVSCDNPYLRDYGGGSCEWSCWDKILAEKP
jgi:hypothetical protein